MRPLIIHKSIHHGNTKLVAEAMAEQMSAEAVALEDVDPDNLAEYDIVGFGSGIYMGKHHRALLSFVESTTALQSKPTFIFYTSGFERFPAMPPFETSLRNALEARGASVLGVFACRGFDTWGPFRIGGGKNKGHPTDEDLTKAREFVRNIISGLH
jgi:flavodoxin